MISYWIVLCAVLFIALVGTLVWHYLIDTAGLFNELFLNEKRRADLLQQCVAHERTQAERFEERVKELEAMLANVRTAVGVQDKADADIVADSPAEMWDTWGDKS